MKGFKEIDISRLLNADWNYKVEDSERSAKLRANIERNGQLENIIVRELPTGLYEVVNGNHRLDVMREIGLNSAFCYNLGVITLQAAQRIAVETNETKFDSDTLKLAELLKSIQGEFDMADLETTMPYSIEELENFENILNYDFTEPGATSSNPGELLPDGKGSPAEQKDGGLVEFRILIPAETSVVWDKWVDRCREILGYDTPGKCFEFAIIEAMNIPIESIQ
jgi:hypothetical protein